MKGKRFDFECSVARVSVVAGADGANVILPVRRRGRLVPRTMQTT